MTREEFRRKSPLAIFLSYFKRHKKLFFVDIGCAVLIAAIDLAFPMVTRKALYDMLPGKLFGVFFAVMAAMVVSYLLRAFLTYIVCYFGHTFGIRVEADIRADLFAHMQKLNFDYYDRNRTGYDGPCGRAGTKRERSRRTYRLHDLVNRNRIGIRYGEKQHPTGGHCGGSPKTIALWLILYTHASLRFVYAACPCNRKYSV